MKNKIKANFLVGCTAVGKTAVCQMLAETQGAAIISADAMQVYRGMNIGTAKPSGKERNNVPYLGLDLIDPDQKFSVAEWLRNVAVQLEALLNDKKNTTIIASGGTGLYAKALIFGLSQNTSPLPEQRAIWQTVFRAEGVKGLQNALIKNDPDAVKNLRDPLNPRRLMRALEIANSQANPRQTQIWKQQTPGVIVGLRMPREQLHSRIAERVDRMFEAGFADEVQSLRQKYTALSSTATQAIGYAEVMEWLDRKISLKDAVNRIVVRTRQLAKRQETWFRHQLDVAWVDITLETPVSEIAKHVKELWKQHGSNTLRFE